MLYLFYRKNNYVKVFSHFFDTKVYRESFLRVRQTEGVKDFQAQRWQGIPSSARRVALDLIRFGPRSRSELAERIGLSPASLTRVTAPLLEAGLLEELEPTTPSGLGRPTIPLTIANNAMMLIGISITPTGVTGILTGPRSDILASHVCELNTHGVTAVTHVIEDVVGHLFTRAREIHPASDITAIGVCLGGHITPSGRVTRAPFLNWRDVPLRELLQQSLEYPVIIENDLIALAEAESWFGVGQEVDRFFVLTVGAGTGFALVIDGDVVRDDSAGYGTVTAAILGEWPDFSHPDNVVDRSAAARKLGRLVGTAAAFCLPEAAVISGEGAFIVAGYEDDLAAGIAEVRHPLASGLDVRLRAHDFAFWARGAATNALNEVVTATPEIEVR